MISQSPTLCRLEERVTDYLTVNDAVGYNRFTDFEWNTLKDSVQPCRSRSSGRC